MAFNRESDLARLLVEDLKRDGWEVYEEVAPQGGGSKRADIVATKNGVTRVIECKLGLGFPVIYQGKKWVGYADEVYVAVPWLYVWKGRSRGTASLAVRTALEIAEIGVIEARVLAGQPTFKHHVPKAWPKPIPRLRSSLEAMLRPEVQEFNATSGSAGSSFWTPFKGTCKKILDLLEEFPDGIPVKDAVSKIEHHYASDKSARGALPSLAKRGAIPGVALEKRGHTPYFVKSCTKKIT